MTDLAVTGPIEGPGSVLVAGARSGVDANGKANVSALVFRDTVPARYDELSLHTHGELALGGGSGFFARGISSATVGLRSPLTPFTPFARLGFGLSATTEASLAETTVLPKAELGVEDVGERRALQIGLYGGPYLLGRERIDAVTIDLPGAYAVGGFFLYGLAPLTIAIDALRITPKAESPIDRVTVRGCFIGVVAICADAIGARIDAANEVSAFTAGVTIGVGRVVR